MRGRGAGLPLPRGAALRAPRPGLQELPGVGARARAPSRQDRRLRARPGHLQERLLSQGKVIFVASALL